MGELNDKELEVVTDFRQLCQAAADLSGSTDREDRIKGHKSWRRARILAPDVAKIAEKRIARLQNEIATLKGDLAHACAAWEAREVK